MPNVFDQFDAPQGAPPATVPASGANVFDQFDGHPRQFDEQQQPPVFLGSFGQAFRRGVSSLYPAIYENTMLGAEQGAVPHPERYGEPLATGSNIFTNDAGELLFRDKNGNVIPADRSKHVFLKGPEGPSVYQRTEATTESPAVGVGRVASLGMASTAPTVAAETAALKAEPVGEASIPALKEAAVNIYRNPDILNRAVDPAAVAKVFQDAAPQLLEFDPAVRQGIMSTLSDLGSRDVRSLEFASRRLGAIAGGNDPVASAAAMKIKSGLDQLIRKVAPEFVNADMNYGAAKATQSLVNRQNIATIRARGDDFAGKMQTQASQLLERGVKDPRVLRGFTPDEIEQLTQISEGTLAGDRLRAFAQTASGKVGALVATAVGAGTAAKTGGMLEGGAALAGTLGAETVLNRFLGGWANRMTASQVNNLTSAIRARSPLGLQLASKLADWNEAWRLAKSTPTSTAVSTLARSSRDLAQSLGMVGMKIRPNELMAEPQAEPQQNQGNVPGPPGQ
jgi:hypothetical protein